MNQLLREERIAFRRVVESLADLFGKLRCADDRFDERPVLGGREGRERDRHEARIVCEGVEHADERVPLVGLGVAVAPDEKRGRRAEPAHDVLKRLDRDFRGVEIFQDEDERPSGGDAREGSREQLEDLDAVLGLPLPGRGDPGIAAHRRPQLADLGQERKE